MVDQAVNDPIPDEDSITKTQLWKKIDYTRSVIEDRSGEVSTSLTRTLLDLKKQQDAALEELIRSQLKIKKALLEDFKHEIQSLLDDQNIIKNKVDSLIKGNESRIDLKMKEFEGAAENLVKDLSSDLYADLTIDFKKLRGEYDELKSDINKALSTYQLESIAKINGIDSKLNSVLSHIESFLKTVCVS